MEYEKCLVELDEVLKYLSEEELLKIPENIRKNIKKNKSKEYIWNYDTSKNLNEQKLNRRTIIMLSYLNTEFLLNEEQNAVMNKIHRYNEEKIEKEKTEKYNPSDLFKPKNASSKSTNNMLIMVEKKKWYQKIFQFIRKFF